MAYEKVGFFPSMAMTHGHGQASADVPRIQAEYANKLLYIATLASAKISIVSLLLLLTASEGHRRVGISLAAFIAVWGLVSVLTAAFQCSRSEPWRAFGAEARCYDMVSALQGETATEKAR